MKSDIASRYPEIASAFLTAFGRAKEDFLAELNVGTGTGKDFTDYERMRGIVGDDPLPFGVEPNEKTLTALVDYALSQHIITKRPDLEEIFI